MLFLAPCQSFEVYRVLVSQTTTTDNGKHDVIIEHDPVSKAGSLQYRAVCSAPVSPVPIMSDSSGASANCYYYYYYFIMFQAIWSTFGFFPGSTATMINLLDFIVLVEEWNRARVGG